MADADAGTRQAAPAVTPPDGTEAKPGEAASVSAAKPGTAVTKPPAASVVTSDHADVTRAASAASHNGSVSPHATTAARHAPAGARPSPDELLAEIEHTREDLARTIDAISDRLSPANNAAGWRTRSGSGCPRSIP